VSAPKDVQQLPSWVRAFGSGEWMVSTFFRYQSWLIRGSNPVDVFMSTHSPLFWAVEPTVANAHVVQALLQLAGPKTQLWLSAETRNFVSSLRRFPGVKVVNGECTCTGSLLIWARLPVSHESVNLFIPY
jgi:hypothetical protein